VLTFRVVSLAAAVLGYGVLLSCSSESADFFPNLHEYRITEKQSGFNFTIQSTGERLFVTYPDLSTLSLNLVPVDILDQETDPCSLKVDATSFLDRISDTPEIDRGFGAHLLFVDSGGQNIVYSDRESEGSELFKWLSRAKSEETWWIAALTGLGKPLIGRKLGEKRLELVLQRSGSLYLYRLEGEDDPQQIAGPLISATAYVPAGAVSELRQGEYWACTAYDSDSQRLYLVRLGEQKASADPLYSSGEVHHSLIAEDRLLILLYEPESSSLLLLEKPLSAAAEDGAGFEVVPVTVCAGTTSVFLAVVGSKRYFLFNERIAAAESENAYRLALLCPKATNKGVRYDKVDLLESPVQIRRFQALQIGRCLYIACLQDGIRLLSFALPDPTDEH